MVWRKVLPFFWPASLIILPLLFWPQLAFGGRVLVGVDLFTYFYPLRDYVSSLLRSGHIPLWNPYLFLGVPLLANIQAGVFYPFNALVIGLPAPLAINWTILIHLGLAGLGSYLFGRRVLGLSRPGAWTAGVVYSLSGFLSAQAEHVNQLTISAWMPWLLLVLDRCVSTNGLGKYPRIRRSWAMLLAILIAVCFLAGHTQTWYIAMCSAGLYALAGAIWHALEQRQAGLRQAWAAGWSALWPRLASLALAIVIGLALSAVQLLPTLELSKLSIRGGGLPYREVVSFSLKPQLLLRAFLPGYGETIFSEYVAYIGWIGLALAAVGLLNGVSRTVSGCRRKRVAWLGGGFAFIGLFLAFGGYNPFYYVLYRLVPGFSLFRVPARWLVLYTLGMAWLAGAGLDACASANKPWIGDALARLVGVPLKDPKSPREQGHRPFPRLRLLFIGAIGVLLLATLGIALWRGWMERPSLLTLAGWAVVIGVIGMLWYLWREESRRAWLKAAFLVALLIELFMAGRSLPLASPTAWDAYASLRTATTHLLAAGGHVGRDGRPTTDWNEPAILGDPTAHWGVGAPTFRFISMSGIQYDPGDQGEMRALWEKRLPERAIYDLIVASKQKEVLAPNLPLLYRIASLDGYDGGILPLARYVTMQSLLLSPEQILPDGRLREQLREVPPARLLRLFNVEYVITDKVQDVWIDDVFYDLQFKAVLGEAGVTEITVENPYAFATTAFGIISHLEGASELAGGTPVALIQWKDELGQPHERELRAGVETAEGQYGPKVAHPPAPAGPAWSDDPNGRSYVARIALGQAQIPREICVRWIGPTGRLVVRGLTLIDERIGAHRSLVVSSQGRFRLVHSGDVKIYQVLDNLPRAYMVGRATVVAGDEQAIAIMREATFEPAKEVLLHEGTGYDYGWDGPRPVELAAYSAGEVVVRTDSDAPGYVVLADAWYPGWNVYVDGKREPIQRANVMFRAVQVPAGQHEVRFRYEPIAFKLGAAISLMVAGALAIAFISEILIRVLRKQNGQTA